MSSRKEWNVVRNNAVKGMVVRFATIAALGAVTGGLLVSTGKEALAQTTYIGNAYGARVSVDLLNLGGAGDLVNVYVAPTGNLPSSGGSLDTGIVANANVQAGLGTLLNPLVTALQADTLHSTSVGASAVTTSQSLIEGLDLFPSYINIGTILSPNLAALLHADTVSSLTTANLGGTSGTSNYVNLRFGGNLVTPTGAVNQTLYLNALGGVSATVGIGDLARLVLNRQTVNGDGSRTTDAIALSVLNGGLLNTLASADVVVASSTAGVTAVVPESGTGALLAAGMLPLAGAVAVRRRQQRRRTTPSVAA